MHKTHALLAAAFAAGALTGALATAGYSLSGADTEPRSAAAEHLADPVAPEPTAVLSVAAVPEAAVGSAATDPAPEEAAAQAGAEEAQAAALETRLRAMTAGWSRMEQQLAGLVNRVDQLERRIAAAPPSASEDPEPAETADGRRSAMVRAGVAEDLAADLLWRESQAELERLEIRDLALREGWFASERYREELTRLEAQVPDLRGELGDEVYDRYLFHAGEENRVRVASVIPGSAAEAAGLAPGDVIDAYGGTRVFSFGELRSATAEGERGELVAVQVVRPGGARMEAWLPRGPLGVRLDLTRMDPDA
jgi:membrane-associated protease RseP (regulator of RpoE activity)